MKIIWSCKNHINGDGRIWSATVDGVAGSSVHLAADLLGTKYGRKMCVGLLLRGRRWVRMSECEQIIETLGPAYFATVPAHFRPNLTGAA